MSILFYFTLMFEIWQVSEIIFIKQRPFFIKKNGLFRSEYYTETEKAKSIIKYSKLYKVTNFLLNLVSITFAKNKIFVVTIIVLTDIFILYTKK